MSNEKLNAISTIERALGIIEGVACGVESAGADMLITAVEMIDEAVKEITDGK